MIMNIWAKISKFVVVLLLGIIAGIVATIKWIAPPGEDITIGKIKVKGKGNNQDTTIEIERTKTNKEKRKERREARRKPV